jgi:hypothetical protein
MKLTTAMTVRDHILYQVQQLRKVETVLTLSFILYLSVVLYNKMNILECLFHCYERRKMNDNSLIDNEKIKK